MKNKGSVAFVIGLAVVLVAGLLLSVPTKTKFRFLNAADPIYCQTTMYAAPGIPARRPIAFWSSGHIPAAERSENGMMYGGANCTRVDNKYHLKQSVSTLSAAARAYAAHPGTNLVIKNSEFTSDHGFILIEYGHDDFVALNWQPASSPDDCYVSVVAMRPTTLFDRVEAFIRDSYRKPKP